ncbi:YqhG family protein [Pontibacillus salicampi]|uniref:YqhG family protein n=1 Tax=Pontibacillus salicampi TaxID=1449801 RepID=A0ABV6LJR4_9BACI
MEQAELHNFLTNYFIANNCDIICNQNGVIEVQLTEEMDEILMNRPFYWNYVKRVGGKGIPMKATFITNPARKEEKGEWLHFGSPRLHQMFQTLKSKGHITKQFEQVKGTAQTPLAPWLCLNVAIHYQGNQKKNDIRSIGIHLINGAIVPSFMERVEHVQLSSTIEDYCFKLSPIIRVGSALKRLEQYLHQVIQQTDLSWVQEAHQKMEEEKELLDYFYRQHMSDEYLEEEEEATRQTARQQYKDELHHLENRFHPTISLEVINTGLFYISQTTSTEMMHTNEKKARIH